MRLLLHTCCGPCLIEPLDALRAHHDVTLMFANPNIRPRAEYQLRRVTAGVYARIQATQMRESDYAPQLWNAAVAETDGSQPERCRACYRLRLGIVAREAARGGFDGIATTLTVSPFQNADVIGEEGTRVAEDNGIFYVHHDFQDRYRSAVERSRELGMYRQNYCGCEPSVIEAEEQRQRRRDERTRRKEHSDSV